MNISLSSLTGALTQPATDRGAAATGGFADAIVSAIGQVESTQAAAQAAARDFLLGGKGEIHGVALASQRAALSLELFQQVRNKFVSAYQEIMRMPM